MLFSDLHINKLLVTRNAMISYLHDNKIVHQTKKELRYIYKINFRKAIQRFFQVTLFSAYKKYPTIFLSYVTDVICEQNGNSSFEKDIGQQI